MLNQLISSSEQSSSFNFVNSVESEIESAVVVDTYISAYISIKNQLNSIWPNSYIKDCALNVALTNARLPPLLNAVSIATTLRTSKQHFITSVLFNVLYTGQYETISH